MTYAQIIKHFGGITATARALGCKVTTVSMWRHGVPFGRQCQIQLHTGGKLRAKLT